MSCLGENLGENNVLNFLWEIAVVSSSIRLCIIPQSNFLRILKNDRITMVLINFTDRGLRSTSMSYTNYNRLAFMLLPDRLSFSSPFDLKLDFWVFKKYLFNKIFCHISIDIVSKNFSWPDLTRILKTSRNFSTSKMGSGVGRLDYRLCSVVPFNISKILWFYSLAKYQRGRRQCNL